MAEIQRLVEILLEDYSQEESFEVELLDPNDAQSAAIELRRRGYQVSLHPFKSRLEVMAEPAQASLAH